MMRIPRVLFIAFCCAACKEPSSNVLLQPVPSRISGIQFENTVVEGDSLNLLDDTNMYNGGGVGLADLNNDGLTDIVLAANQGPSKLYLNKGDFTFEEVSQKSGFITDRWAGGVSIADINGDGWKDIYLSCSVRRTAEERRNYLFLHQGADADGNISFKEVAEKANLGAPYYSTQTAFFDYDLDGDLDAFCLNNTTEFFPHNTPRPQKKDGAGRSNDVLLRNEGVDEEGIPHFSNVSYQANILTEGYGLGLGITDINLDGWPDIYVANDYVMGDILYINQKDGSFSNEIGAYLKHQSLYAHGVDIADIDNNGLSDILVADILPKTPSALKRVEEKVEQANVNELVNRFGLAPQFIRNTLQLNLGLGTFSEIAQLSGLAQSNYSWGPLLMDIDNDGRRDVYMTNGYPKNLLDLDYNQFLSRDLRFGTEAEKKKRWRERMEKLEGIVLPNAVFRNEGGPHFEDRTLEWGGGVESISHGAAYGDLDNDGDLDLVVNNLNQRAFVLQNQSMESRPRNFLRVRLVGDSMNTQAIGTKIYLWAEDLYTNYEHFPVKGYQSSVEPIAHFGLGDIAKVDSIKVIWPDGQYTVLRDIVSNQVLELTQGEQSAALAAPENSSKLLFKESVDRLGLDFSHQETRFTDLDKYPLLFHDFNREGPRMSVGDVNGDGWEDLFIGGASMQEPGLFLQDGKGRFVQQAFPECGRYEDVASLFFDADKDGDLDLFVVSGGTDYPQNSLYYADRLYMNDGKGNFEQHGDALPEHFEIGSCVAASDIDNDGDLDLFVGNRLKPGEYPSSPPSFIYENQEGTFVDVTEKRLEGGSLLGMTTDAQWADLNEDGKEDLVVVGEWMPISVWINFSGKLVKYELEDLKYSFGWWQRLWLGDINDDGDIDMVAGNIGSNTRYKTHWEAPLQIWKKDFDKNGMQDPIISYMWDNQRYPTHPMDAISRHIPAMKRRFKTYGEYADATMDEVIIDREQAEMEVKEAYVLETMVIENREEGYFRLKWLPSQAQFAPVKAILVSDLDGDERKEIMMAGNFYGVEPGLGRYDAGVGTVLKRREHRWLNFDLMPLTTTGLKLDKEVRDIKEITTPKGRIWVVANNNDVLQIFRLSKEEQ